MAMVAHNPAAAKRVGIPQSVGREYVNADKGKKFKEGGMAKGKMGSFPMGQGMGKVKTAAPSRDGVAIKGKTKGKQIKMAGSTKGMKRGGKACG